MSHNVAAVSLRPGDVARITSHICHGREVSCGDHHIAITRIRTDYDLVFIDYTPLSTWAGCKFHSGTVTYERTTQVDVLWHDEIGAVA